MHGCHFSKIDSGIFCERLALVRLRNTLRRVHVSAMAQEATPLERVAALKLAFFTRDDTNALVAVEKLHGGLQNTNFR